MELYHHRRQKQAGKRSHRTTSSVVVARDAVRQGDGRLHERQHLCRFGRRRCATRTVLGGIVDIEWESGDDFPSG